MRSLFSLLAFGLAAIRSFVVETALAQCSSGGRCIIVNTGVTSTVQTIIQGIVNTLLMWSTYIATAVFLVGAIFMVGSVGSENWSANGKKLMKAAVIGFAIVLGAWLIVSTTVFFIAA
jgi:hypothetical protein